MSGGHGPAESGGGPHGIPLTWVVDGAVPDDLRGDYEQHEGHEQQAPFGDRRDVISSSYIENYSLGACLGIYGD